MPPKKATDKAVFFPTPAEFRAWLERHAGTETSLEVGFYKVASGRPSITWPESVDEALCVGWIDGVRRSIDQDSYRIRFSPRRPRSTWSKINIERVRVLTEEGRMKPAGLAVFAQRREDRSGSFSYEQDKIPQLTPADERTFRKNKPAWAYFTQQPPGYRKRVLWWLSSARQEATRQGRLARLIAVSAEGKRVY
jgi:uncharacterized protein YdeI (YjbR/CyaY-like superfamily)